MNAGDRVYYLLPKSRPAGRDRMWALAATVEKVGVHRVTILLDSRQFYRRRCVDRFSVTPLRDDLGPEIEIRR